MATLGLLIILLNTLAIIIDARFGRPHAYPLTPARLRLVCELKASLQASLLRSAYRPANDLLGGLQRMKIGGVLIHPQDANALTHGQTTYFTEFFFQKKTRCQQMQTLLWEAMRVAGNYVEVDQPVQYRHAQHDVEQAFAAVARDLGCERDLPPGVGLRNPLQTPDLGAPPVRPQSDA